MENTLRSNFIKSSNLLFMTLGLVIISFVITQMFIPNESNKLSLVIINLILIGSIGLIVRQGRNWAKYLSLTLIILYLIEASFFLINPEVNLITQIVFVVQIMLVAWATLILFVNFQKKKD